MFSDKKLISEKIVCYHCGEDCSADIIEYQNKHFCCNGCKTVYQMLDDNNLCDYYNYDEKPGISQKNKAKRYFDFLDEPEIKNKIIEFSNSDITTVTFIIPSMHCSSCIWILENLYKINPSIIYSKADFLNKTVTLKFKTAELTIKNVAEILDSLGYTPSFDFENDRKGIKQKEDRKLLYRLGVAGFSFGNIMLFSFPEYLGLGYSNEIYIAKFFGLMNLILSIPILFWGADIYIISALKGLKNKILNIDVPISVGIIILFARSFYEYTFLNEAGYFDSFSGLIFFLLIGRFFQDKTYSGMNFERDYKSFFPISVLKKSGNIEKSIPLSKLKVKDRLVIRMNEIVPADSVLISESAGIDYSFVTGESDISIVNNGDFIFAGGIVKTGLIEADVVKEVSQSYLTKLWNNKNLKEFKKTKLISLSDEVSKYFSYIILIYSVIIFVIWSFIDLSKAVIVTTSVLIVACPCALALSIPFTYGSITRIFGRNNLYLKNNEVIERLSKITKLIFDKTGTLSYTDRYNIRFIALIDGVDLSLIKSLVRNSSHPLSRAIYDYLKSYKIKSVDGFMEYPGKGISGFIENTHIKIGSEEYVDYKNSELNIPGNVYVSVNNLVVGYFIINSVLREGITEEIHKLKKQFNISIITGDGEKDKKLINDELGDDMSLSFKQTPEEKLKKVYECEQSGEKVLMLGDGLNDAGALRVSNVGIAVSDNVNNFTPASDAIILGKELKNLSKILKLSVIARRIVIASYIISFLYNIIGLYFASTGELSPIISAILMPVSSITIVLFTTSASFIFARKIGLKI